MGSSLRRRDRIRDMTADVNPATVTVRRAETPDEIDAAGQMALTAYVASGFASEHYRDYLADSRSRAEQAELLVAVDGSGRIVGTVTYTVAGQPYAEISRPGESEFRMLGVDPVARGHGVGELLVNACIERARRDGSTAVAICSMTEMTAAQSIYARLGFVRDPERDWQPIPTVQLLGLVLTL
jgi:GNAT superfamily N-acetyltransferase